MGLENPREGASQYLWTVLMSSLMTRAARGSVSELPSRYGASHLHPVRRPLLGVADQARTEEV